MNIPRWWVSGAISLLCLFGCSRLELDPVHHIQFDGMRGQVALAVNGTPLFETVRPDPERSPEERADEIFRFLAENFTVWHLEPNNTLGAALYGYGFGLCGMESRIMVALWKEHQVEGRLVTWPKHVMAEAQLEGQWHLFDGQHKTNFSSLFGQSVSFEALNRCEVLLPRKLNPIGYHGDYLQNLFVEAVSNRLIVAERVSRPTLVMDAGRKIEIYPRASEPKYPRPVKPAAQNRIREHLIPGYELVVTQIVVSDRVVLNTGLPILGVEVPEGTTGTATYQGLEKPLAAKDFALLAGFPRELEFSLPKQTRLVVTYSLAGWVGDRLFEDGANISWRTEDESGRVRLIRKKQPIIELSDLATGVPDEQGTMTVSFTLSWDKMAYEQPVEYELFLDELSSHLPLEAWTYLKTWQWTWNMDVQGNSGSQSFQFQWKPRSNGGPRRPDHFRTILAHIKGPGIAAGHNYLIHSLELDHGQKAN